MKLTKTTIGAAFAAATLALSAVPALAQSVNTEELANLQLGHCHDLWAEGDYIYVARGHDGLDVTNAADPENPYTVSTIRPFPAGGRRGCLLESLDLARGDAELDDLFGRPSHNVHLVGRAAHWLPRRRRAGQLARHSHRHVCEFVAADAAFRWQRLE